MAIKLKSAAQTFVWAYYFLVGRPEEVLEGVQACLDMDADDDHVGYFGLAANDNDDRPGAHFGDGAMTVYLEPTDSTEPLKQGEEAFLLILTGEADDLDTPIISPPVVRDSEAVDFGSIKATNHLAAVLEGRRRAEVGLAPGV